MNTEQVSKYLGINEKKVYKLITEKKLPATKITGKWTFLKDMVDRWLEGDIDMDVFLRQQKGVLLITGSDDMLFSQITNILNKYSTDIFPFFCKTGSLKGLDVMKQGKAHIAGTHLLDEDSREYNIPFIDSYLEDRHIVTMNFASREQGLIVKKNNPKHIIKLEDIARRGIRFINRQKGSGTRNLLDLSLKKLGISSLSVNGYKKEVTTHLEVGLHILNNSADCGIGIKSVSNMLGLGFVPLSKERFDIVILKEVFFSNSLQNFIEILRSAKFKRIASALGGYDTKTSGKVIYTN